MASNTLDTIIENLFYVLPIIHKKLLKIEPQDISPDFSLSRLHMGILAILNENTVQISEIAKTFLIPKPQMTHLIGQLVNAALVERQANTSDRRVTNISLTDKGRGVFKHCDELLKTNVRKRLSFLTEKELEELSLSLQKLRDIGSRFDNRGK